MRSKLAMVAIMLLLAVTANAGLFWGSGANVITDFNGDPVPTSNNIDPTEGAFAQLIRILSGTNPYDFVPSGSGINVLNEQVVDVMYAGLYDDLADPGVFAFNTAAILNDVSYNGYYYVRVFDAPQASEAAWNLGTSAPIPSSAQYYYQSSVLNYSHDNENPPIDFYFGPGQTLNAIPEPTTMLLMAGGLIGMLAIRRKHA